MTAFISRCILLSALLVGCDASTQQPGNGTFAGGTAGTEDKGDASWDGGWSVVGLEVNGVSRTGDLPVKYVVVQDDVASFVVPVVVNAPERAAVPSDKDPVKVVQTMQSVRIDVRLLRDEDRPDNILITKAEAPRGSSAQELPEAADTVPALLRIEGDEAVLCVDFAQAKPPSGIVSGLGYLTLRLKRGGGELPTAVPLRRLMDRMVGSVTFPLFAPVASDGPGHHLVVLDYGAPSQVVEAGLSLWNRALEYTQSQASAIGADDTFSVVVVGEQIHSKSFAAGETGELAVWLRSARPTGEVGLEVFLKRAGDAVAQLPAEPGVTRLSLVASPPVEPVSDDVVVPHLERLRGVADEISFVSLSGQEAFPNVAITDVRLPSSGPSGREDQDCTIQVSNSGPRTVQCDCAVSNGMQLFTLPVEVESGATASVSFAIPPMNRSGRTGERQSFVVELKGLPEDANTLRDDDLVELPLPNTQPVSVLFVEPQRPAVDFRAFRLALERLAAPRGEGLSPVYELSSVPFARFPWNDEAPSDVVIFSEVNSLSGVPEDGFRRLVQRQQPMLVCLGTDCMPEVLDQLGPAESPWGAITGESSVDVVPALVSVTLAGHPLLTGLADDGLYLFRYCRIEDDHDDADVLLRAGEADPVLFRNSAGNIVVSAFPWTLDAANLVQEEAFLCFVDDLVWTLADRGGSVSFARVGDQIDYSPYAPDDYLSVIYPDGVQSLFALRGAEEHPERFEEPGCYRFLKMVRQRRTQEEIVWVLPPRSLGRGKMSREELRDWCESHAIGFAILGESPTGSADGEHREGRRPVRPDQAGRPNRSRVALLIDCSQSMGFEHPSRLDRIKGLLQADEGRWLKQLVKAHEVLVYGFGANEPADGGPLRIATLSNAEDVERFLPALQEIAPTGKQTRIGDAVAFVLSRRQAALNGVVLFSDGANNGGRNVREASGLARLEGIPIFAVAVGSVNPLRNVVIQEVLSPEQAWAGDEVRVELRVRADIELDEETSVRILRLPLPRARGAAPVAEAEPEVVGVAALRLRADGIPVGLSLSLTAPEPGRHRYAVEVDSLPGEFTTHDNRDIFDLETLEPSPRVLLIDTHPHGELDEFRKLLVDTGHYDVEAFYSDRDRRTADAEGALARLPEGIEEWSRYDVIAIGDVSPTVLGPTRAEAIRRLVERGMSLLMVAGPTHGIATWESSPLGKLLPGQVVERESNERLESDEWTVEWTSAFARAGRQPAPELELPELHWVSLDWRAISPLATVWADVHTGYGRPEPLFVTQDYGRGRIRWHATNETWRWSQGESAEFYKSMS